MATLDEIAQLGPEEKEAARVYVVAGPTGRRAPMSVVPSKWKAGNEQRERMAFLQGIAWERARAEKDGI